MPELDSPRDKSETKLLLLYLFKSYKKGMSMSEVTQAMMTLGVNYFDLGGIIDEMLISGHIDVNIRENELKEYIMTNLGDETCEILSATLSLSVRSKVAGVASEIAVGSRKESETKFYFTEVNDGFFVYLSILEKEAELFSIKIHVPTRLQAELICYNFEKNPSSIYGGIVDMLIDQKDDRIFT